MRFILVFILILIFATVGSVFIVPYQPFVEERTQAYTKDEEERLYFEAQPIGDPFVSSLGIQGELAMSGEIDMYVFLPKTDGYIPVELLIAPSKNTTLLDERFDPTVAFISPALQGYGNDLVPFVQPINNDVHAFHAMESTAQITSFDLATFSSKSLAIKDEIHVSAHQLYFIAIYSPSELTGTYLLKLGKNKNFSTPLRNTFPTTADITPQFSDIFDANSKNEGISAYERELFASRSNPITTSLGPFTLWIDTVRFVFSNITRGITGK